MLESYPWPGNARELRNVIERMAILTPGERLTRESIPVEIRVQREPGPKSTIQEARESAEREHILRALEESNWNVSGRRARAGDGADQSAQAHPRAGVEPGEVACAVFYKEDACRWGGFLEITYHHRLETYAVPRGPLTIFPSKRCTRLPWYIGRRSSIRNINPDPNLQGRFRR